MRKSYGRQSYVLLRSIRTVPITPDLSKAFCQFFSRFKRACCVEWAFLKPHNFGDNTGMTSATFNSYGKDFVQKHLLIQFVIAKTSFLANLIMAGDISSLERFLMSISFMYLKILSAETNPNLKLKDFLNFSFYCLDTWVIVEVLNFFSNI